MALLYLLRWLWRAPALAVKEKRGMKPPVHPSPPIIGILAFDGVETLDLVRPLEVLKAASTYDDSYRRRACYQILILGLTGKTFVTESGLVLKADRTLASAPALDTVVIPGTGGKRLPESERLAAVWLRNHAADIRRLVSVSTGLSLLAASGLLAGRQVVTHWRCAREIARRFPSLRMEQGATFMRDGRFYSCGGGNAAIEMSLALIEEDFGQRVALEVAREFVIRLRPAGREEAIAPERKEEWDSAERLSDLPAWILAHLDSDLSVEVLAARSCLCSRHFARVFKRTFKTTPAEFVERLRLGEARRRLLLPQATVLEVAAAVGFRSADAFRRAFERELGVTPSTFRILARSRYPAMSAARSSARAPLFSRK